MSILIPHEGPHSPFESCSLGTGEWGWGWHAPCGDFLGCVTACVLFCCSIVGANLVRRGSSCFLLCARVFIVRRAGILRISLQCLQMLVETPGYCLLVSTVGQMVIVKLQLESGYWQTIDLWQCHLRGEKRRSRFSL